MAVTELPPGQSVGDTHNRGAGGDSPTIRQLIRERLAVSDEPDPHVIADDLAAEVTEEIAREVLRAGLVGLVREEIRGARIARPANPSSRKWENVAEQVALNGDIFQRRYQTADGWKLLGDFTRDDAQWTRDQYVRRAAEHEAHAAQFERLAKRLKRGQVVRDLDRADVEELFNA
jgi:hypothetical protein